MYKLLINTCKYNQVFSSMITEKIMSAFSNIHFTSDSVRPEIKDDILQKKLTPTLKLISYILESSLQSDSFAKKEYDVSRIFLKNFHLEQHVWTIIMMGSQNRELLFDLHKVMVLCYFFGLAIDSEEEYFQMKDSQRMFEKILKLLKIHLAQKDTLNIVKLCHLLQYYWKLVSCRVKLREYDSENPPLLFANQILLFQVAPIFVVSHSHCKKNKCGVTEEDGSFRDDFVTKIVKAMCENTLRVVYNFREVLTSDKDVFDNGLKAIMYVMKSKQFYHRDRAVIVFQVLIYVLEDIITEVKETPSLVQVFTKQARYFSAHFDALATLIEEFEITWRESVETICVMGISLEFMNFSNWPPHLVVQILRLIKLSIAKFMSPNLALLVDKTSDSTLTYLGPMLTAKLHDVSWEVRDSALEVLQTVSNIAYTKFPSFQNVILECEFPTLMVTMSTYDSESFVRASAIKCLQEMIKVPRFWEDVLEEQSLPEKMLNILYNETEGIVRCEAASLMYQIYEHQSFPAVMEDEINKVMVHAAISDLHWEVKLKALCYWSKMIDKQLSNEGMIDGTFPSVTFSKEHRKIVTLTESEVRNRLKKVLVELSRCGCLDVLITAMRDDCDLKVAREAVEITKKLSTLLNTYSITDYEKPNTILTSRKAVMDTFHSSCSSIPKICSSDDVINEIVNCRDVNLLKGVYVNDKLQYSLLNGLKYETKCVSPKEFIHFVQKDLNDLIGQKEKWLNEIDNLDSLLDDILKKYQDNDVNAMDCY